VLETAERLFAERGLAAVSLREIGAAAGQRNPSVVQFHWQSKQGLVDAILALRMRAIDVQRLAVLEQLERDGRAGDLKALVEALVHPFLAALAPGTCYARFLAAVWIDQLHGRLVTLPLREMEGLRRIQRRLRARLTALPPRLRQHRLDLLGTMLIASAARHEHEMQRRRASGRETPVLVSDLVQAIVAMLSAPRSRTSTAKAARRTLPWATTVKMSTGGVA
jgi:AcrR family transcriptional regulator